VENPVEKGLKSG